MNTQQTPVPFSVKYYASRQAAVLDNQGREVAFISEYGDKARTLANLFAAAPDLLEACEVMARYVNCPTCSGAILDWVMPAIAAAKGE
jgi:hypothetical protein